MKKSLQLGGLMALLFCTPAFAEVLVGKVTETMNAASYTYVLVDTGTKRAWAAAPQFAVKVGDTVTVADGLPMQNYQSKTLNRTFDVVYFSGNVQVAGKSSDASTPGPVALPKGHPALPGTAAPAPTELPKGHPALPGAVAPASIDFSGIKRAENGQTVAEILAGQGKFVGKPVALRARVVKYNGGILGKNWLHVRDGSGAEGSNDLVVTTDATVKVGDLVLVKGKLSANRDFGSGYRYALIVEDATVVAQ